MSRKKTHEEFVKELNSINSNIEITGRYINSRTKINCRCLICDNEWEVVTNHLLMGRGCPACAGVKRKSCEDFIDEMKNINPNIKIIGKYINNKAKVGCSCLVCGNTWEATPCSLLSGSGCPKCATLKVADVRRKSHKIFVDEMKIINPAIRIIDKYINNRAKIECECKICNHKWSAKPANLLRGIGCPRCEKSKGECKIERFLKGNNISYISQKKFDDLTGCGGGKLSYDFFIPSCNILIEFNGLQHEKPIKHFGGKNRFEIQKDHDKRKYNYAKEHNIDLLEIWYYDYDNIDQILSEKLHINNIEKSA